MRRAQTALEFLILTGFMLFIFTTFFFVIKEQSATAAQQTHHQELAAIAETINSEVIIASQVHDGYIRAFDLPYTAAGDVYTITFPSSTELNIRTADSEYLLFLTANVTVAGGKLFPGTNTITKQNGNISITSFG